MIDAAAQQSSMNQDSNPRTIESDSKDIHVNSSDQDQILNTEISQKSKIWVDIQGDKEQIKQIVEITKNNINVSKSSVVPIPVNRKIYGTFQI